MTSTWKTSKGTWKGTQASAGLGVGEQPDVDVEVVEHPTEDPELQHVQEALDALRGAGRLALFRKKPTWCAGYLTTIELGPNEEIDLAQIKADWGGGEIQFRPQRYTANGVRFAPGGRTLRFTGPPRENGLEITPDGLGLRTQPSGAQLVIHDRPPAVRPTQDPGMAQVFGHVLETMNRQNDRFMQLLVAQLGQQRGPTTGAAAADPLQALTQSIRAYRQLDGLLGSEEPEEEQQPDEPAWLGKIIERVLEKMDKPKGQQQPQQPPPGGSTWRLHKSEPTPQSKPKPAPQATQATTLGVRELLQSFRSLGPRERMELLGTLSNELDPDLIREWMAANFDGGEAVGG